MSLSILSTNKKLLRKFLIRVPKKKDVHVSVNDQAEDISGGGGGGRDKQIY